jgi:hypothetical protein
MLIAHAGHGAQAENHEHGHSGTEQAATTTTTSQSSPTNSSSNSNTALYVGGGVMLATIVVAAFVWNKLERRLHKRLSSFAQTS